MPDMSAWHLGGCTAEDAIAAASFGAEADKAESLEVIMSRLDASRDPSSASDLHSLSPASTGFEFAEQASAWSPPCRRPPQRAEAVRPAVHPKPFGPTRAVGGSFQGSGQLPHRDLTSWEQQRAVMPQRSWGISAAACVARPGGLRAASPGQTANHSEAFAPVRTVVQQRMLPCSCPHSPSQTMRSPAQALRSTSTTMQDSRQMSRRMQVSTSVPPPGHESVRARGEAENSVQAVQARGDAEDQVRALQEHRRRLRAELRRTEHRLAATLEADWPQAAPQQSLPSPSAGGPFAGRRAVMDRFNAAAGDRSKVVAAATSYSYLGPGADGPPLPEIHPLWS
eukprot:TRINITY_DN23647_c0_g1_i1.p1 TRINITY_DN23647_c0_g1~~TRINITY_DN23647_c0_g1_i1.p1  ORF type:complete len:352 (+),score=54.85 TRINITY_DN23647_c0_g1_i1:40-1056(+)